MLTQQLDYPLPPACIATEPAQPRDSAKLMVIHRQSGRIEHRQVRDLPALAGGPGPGDLLIFNQTKVIPALIQGIRRNTGGQVKGLYVASAGELWQVMLESRGSLGPGEWIDLDPAAALELLASQGGGRWQARLHSSQNTLDLLNRIGQTPLPPYIRKQRRAAHQPEVQPQDQLRYNTVFARDSGSVAAPTAALHFTPELLADLDARGVKRANLTLHIGLGTFMPVRVDDLAQHVMHSEHFHIPAATLALLRQTRAAGGRIIPVGTTCVRALESLPAHLPDEPAGYTGDTRLFICPAEAGQQPFAFRFADALLTNFHLPRSTLLALVAALPEVGLDRLKDWYAQAVAQGYRFYSYGDAMLLL